MRLWPLRQRRKVRTGRLFPPSTRRVDGGSGDWGGRRLGRFVLYRPRENPVPTTTTTGSRGHALSLRVRMRAARAPCAPGGRGLPRHVKPIGIVGRIRQTGARSNPQAPAIYVPIYGLSTGRPAAPFSYLPWGTRRDDASPAGGRTGATRVGARHGYWRWYSTAMSMMLGSNHGHARLQI